MIGQAAEAIAVVATCEGDANLLVDGGRATH